MNRPLDTDPTVLCVRIKLWHAQSSGAILLQDWAHPRVRVFHLGLPVLPSTAFPPFQNMLGVPYSRNVHEIIKYNEIAQPQRPNEGFAAAAEPRIRLRVSRVGRPA